MRGNVGEIGQQTVEWPSGGIGRNKFSMLVYRIAEPTVQTDRTLPNNKPDITIRDKK